MREETKIKIIIAVAILVILIICSCVFRGIDKARVEKGEMPLFCVQMAEVGDGGSKIYIGLGYKVISYHNSNGYEALVFGGWDLEYDGNLGEETQTEPQVEEVAE